MYRAFRWSRHWLVISAIVIWAAFRFLDAHLIGAGIHVTTHLMLTFVVTFFIWIICWELLEQRRFKKCKVFCLINATHNNI